MYYPILFIVFLLSPTYVQSVQSSDMLKVVCKNDTHVVVVIPVEPGEKVKDYYFQLTHLNHVLDEHSEIIRTFSWKEKCRLTERCVQFNPNHTFGCLYNNDTFLSKGETRLTIRNKIFDILCICIVLLILSILLN
jgi:hypothetical protein